VKKLLRFTGRRFGRLVNRQGVAPAGTQQLRSYEAHQAGKVAAGGEGDEAPVLSAAAGEDLASDGDSCEGTVYIHA